MLCWFGSNTSYYKHKYRARQRITFMPGEKKRTCGKERSNFKPNWIFNTMGDE